MSVEAAVPLETQDSWQRDLARSARRVSVAVCAGAVSGGLVGGLGGRIAMLILRLTSSAELHGVKTDDGFTIGRISGDTFFLVGLTMLAGVVTGIIYLLIRSWLPAARRPLYNAGLWALVGGSAVIRPHDGIDFVKLDPLVLACVLFIVLPALHGALVSSLTERWLPAAERPGRSWLSWVLLLLGALPLALFGPFGLAFVLAAGLGWLLNRYVPVARLWTSNVVTWIGRAALTAVGGVALVTLVGDVAEVL